MRLVGPHISERGIESIVRRTILRYDKDGDGKLSFLEFKDALVNTTDIANDMVLNIFPVE